MTGPRSPLAGWWRTLVFTGLATVLSFIAAMAMFSAFMFYDDEGYVLISLRNYAAHGGLYREVYTQYGPFPFVLYHLLGECGLPFTHIAGRLVTLSAWIGAALACAAVVWQATRSFFTCLPVLAGAFVYLWIMISEPTHPGSLIALLVAVAAALGYRWIAREHRVAWAGLAGLVAGALVLTKINVGAFVVLAALAWIWLHHESPGPRRWAPALVAAAGILLPLALMRPMLAMGWVQSYALIFACAAVAAALVTARQATPQASWRMLGWSVAGGLAVAAIVLVPVMLRGTSFREIIEGVLLNPLKQPAAFNLRYVWPAGSATLAIVSLLLCLAAIIMSRTADHAVAVAVAALRLIAAAGLACALLDFPNTSPDRMVFGYGVPWLWLFLWPLPGGQATARPALAWVGWLWLGQVLHAFPVAGSQIAWGTFLALPLAAIGAHDALHWLLGRHPAAFRLSPRAIAWLGRGLLAALTLALAWRFSSLGNRYREGSDLNLPGAEIMRLPSESSALFRALAVNAAAHGDMLFSEPGMFSLNLWSGLPTPTLANTTHWFSLLNQPRQQAIIRALEAHPRACVIVQRDHMAFLTKRSFAPAGVLHDYIAEHFTPAFTLDDFDFCVRKGRRIEPLLLGELALTADQPGRENTVLRLRLHSPHELAVARVELTAPRMRDSEPLVFGAQNARAELTPTDQEGTPTGPTQTVSWPFRFTGTATIAIHFDRFAQPRPYAGGLIRLRGPDQAEVALARLRQ